MSRAVRVALVVAGTVLAAWFPNAWMREAFGTPQTLGDVIASLCLSILYGHSLGTILARRVVRFLLRRPR